jgi:hypothetical protein
MSFFFNNFKQLSGLLRPHNRPRFVTRLQAILRAAGGPSVSTMPTYRPSQNKRALRYGSGLIIPDQPFPPPQAHPEPEPMPAGATIGP